MIEQLQTVLSPVQSNQDKWEERNEVLAPLANLIGEYDHTKVIRKGS